MGDIIPQTWIEQLANAINDPKTLLTQLQIDPAKLQAGFDAKKLFAQRVPQSFINKMERGNPNDPLLRQVLPVADEFLQAQGFSCDPLNEQANAIPGLLHKYENRVLLIVKGGCAINCRYCFRRHFPYADNPSGKKVWLQQLEHIRAHPQITEVILSGGDPLMAKDHELAWLIGEISQIPHVQRLRIHSRLATVIPDRITSELLSLLASTRLMTILVTHINHAREIGPDVVAAMQKLAAAKVTLLNQSVLLRGVNDDTATLKELSEALFSAGILPYYLHLLDKVQGAAHFLVPDDEARAIMGELIEQLSGYLVPRLTREISDRKSKTLVDLHLE
ncbi:MAG: EF-P beta-lysylation protein EpmB [Vibrionaceae bacterium]